MLSVRPVRYYRGSSIRPLLYFFGEEITLAVRLWTYGWDLFYPNEPILYHDWKRKRRRTHFDDHHNWGELDALSVRRVRHLLGIEQSTDAAVLDGIENYGLGQKRSLDEYQRYSGINFLKRRLSPQAKQGAPYPPFAKNGEPKQNFRIMTKALEIHKPRKVLSARVAWCTMISCPRTCTERLTSTLARRITNGSTRAAASKKSGVSVTVSRCAACLTFSISPMKPGVPNQNPIGFIRPIPPWTALRNT
jgi:hypothetical protein